MRIRMYKAQIDFIEEKRLEGWGSTRIGRELGIPITTVSSYLIRNPEPRDCRRCLYCGKYVKQIPGRKPKLYCDKKCSNAYWNHRRSEKEND